MNQTNGARYLNQFERDESVHQSHIGTYFHSWTIELAVGGNLDVMVKTDRTWEDTSKGTTHRARSISTLWSLRSYNKFAVLKPFRIINAADAEPDDAFKNSR